MPLTYYCGEVSGLLEQFWKGNLGTVEHIPVVAQSVQMAVFSRQHDRPARGADGVGYKALVEADALPGNAVDIGRLDQRTPIAADGLGGVIVGHDEQDVGLSGGLTESERAG